MIPDALTLIREWRKAKQEMSEASIGPIISNPGAVRTSEELKRISAAHFALLRAEERLIMYADSFPE